MNRAIRLLAAAGLLAGACTADNPDYVWPDGGPPAGGGGGGSFSPSHVGPIWFDQGTAALTINSAIDTGRFTIDGKAVPAGVVFAETEGVALLGAREVSVPAGAKVRVTGSRPLVIVAGNQIVIEGLLDVSAHAREPGPGGSDPGAGPGAGKKGASVGNLDSGGGGAGHGGDGGGSGNVGGNCGGQPASGVAGGGKYGDARLSKLTAGSGGGIGNLSTGCRNQPDPEGGAGGGALQLTARNLVRVAGQINAGGGGGRPGCAIPGQINSGSGGGGGSGGAILIEALAVDLRGGAIAANGGAGGGGAYNTAGGAGADGALGATAAAGGAGGVDVTRGNAEVTEQRGGAGGTMGNGAGSANLTNCGNSGGGGGAAGRIYLRSRSAASVQGAVVSPPATMATL